ncbi:MAG: phosphoenolpyruvate--protein phosphotransferase [Formivibrio sp.]|nr:phosphoenolpyruvate--protein phosphotransferase [Formivibrio sp.]
MSITLQGIGIGGGIAIGYARLVTRTNIEVAHYRLAPEDVRAEIERFENAIRHTRKELETLWSSIPENAPAELGAFLSLHIMLLNDHTLSHEPIDLIENEHCNAEWALQQQLEVLLSQFDEIEDEYLRERRSDVLQVVERVQKTLAGHDAGSHIQECGTDCILVAHDLSPADMVLFKDSRYLAFITDVGGPTSHTAILARSLDLPSVLALRHARELIREGELIIVDGVSGVVVIDPDERVLEEYRTRSEEWLGKQRALLDIRLSRPVTLDGIEVELFGNIELPDDTEDALEYGATGIGLFRSEFLFLSEDDLPTEEEQFEAYRRVVQMMEGRPVVIRTLDLGKDKVAKWQQESLSPNPALGLTGIRLCLAEPQVFRTQLRAILRASAFGPVKLLLPMLSQIAEVRATRNHIEEVKAQLREEGIPYGDNVELGGMIETPAAAVAVAKFLAHLDYISIGTNDLIQYTMAVDRTDDAVSHLYDPLHPAVLALISHVIATADRMGKSVAMCGEMAGDPQLSRLLLGLGLRRFSMLPIQLLKVKQQLLTADLSTIRPLVERMLAAEESDQMRDLLLELNR